jgi:hypothetical protein
MVEWVVDDRLRIVEWHGDRLGCRDRDNYGNE